MKTFNMLLQKSKKGGGAKNQKNGPSMPLIARQCVITLGVGMGWGPGRDGQGSPVNPNETQKTGACVIRPPHLKVMLSRCTYRKITASVGFTEASARPRAYVARNYLEYAGHSLAWVPDHPKNGNCNCNYISNGTFWVFNSTVKPCSAE